VAARAGVPDGWLNDAVKGLLSPRGVFETYLELPNLRVFVAHPTYLLAMKCAALRLGEEFHDLDDVRFLLRYLDVTTAGEALAIVTRYFDEHQLQPKTRLALEDLLRLARGPARRASHPRISASRSSKRRKPWSKVSRRKPPARAKAAR
jgi:hypothetical protein